MPNFVCCSKLLMTCYVISFWIYLLRCVLYFAGVANMTALGNVVSWQKLDYDFEFHKQPFHTDMAVLVLSEGKSLLKVCFNFH